MKIIAFYLPQFHPIKENDEWWGKGFTEWTNVKKAGSLFHGHAQPKEPLDDNYYSLLEKETHKWQLELMNKYSIYGLCYYHYWFSGKKLLQKPLEILLNNKDISTNFCMSWANEPWTRAWDGKTRDILIDQEYGDEKDWEEHFNYLLQFFKDNRYIKIDSKPLFVIYRTNNIDKCEEMLSLWKELATKNGLKGLYIVETMNSFQIKPALNISEAVIEFEPMYTLKNDMSLVTQGKRLLNKKLGTLDKFDYDKVWNRILNRNTNYKGKEKFSGAFIDWDNSPRKGARGTICIGASPEKFKRNIEKLIYKCKKEGNDKFIFINAWNEWAEGTYLEPDKMNKYKYLEAIKGAMDKLTKVKL